MEPEPTSNEGEAIVGLHGPWLHPSSTPRGSNRRGPHAGRQRQGPQAAPRAARVPPANRTDEWTAPPWGRAQAQESIVADRYGIPAVRRPRLSVAGGPTASFRTSPYLLSRALPVLSQTAWDDVAITGLLFWSSKWENDRARNGTTNGRWRFWPLARRLTTGKWRLLVKRAWSGCGSDRMDGCQAACMQVKLVYLEMLRGLMATVLYSYS
ncbi:hypothetical protein BS78_06G203000 [Paspalum vaginatum]|nr:hypothetical protein BS78_06G203000 [Paspalum vaginatum]